MFISYIVSNLICLFCNIFHLYIIISCWLFGNVAVLFLCVQWPLFLCSYILFIHFDSFVIPCQCCERHVCILMLDKLRRCPACWLAHILNLIKTRRCLVSRTPILADLPHFYCSGYVQALLCLYNQDMHLYHDCGGLFPSHAGIIYCFVCRDRRRTVLQMPVIFNFSSTALLNLFC